MSYCLAQGAKFNIFKQTIIEETMKEPFCYISHTNTTINFFLNSLPSPLRRIPLCRKGNYLISVASLRKWVMAVLKYPSPPPTPATLQDGTRELSRWKLAPFNPWPPASLKGQGYFHALVPALGRDLHEVTSNRWDSISGFFSIFYLVWMAWSPPRGSQAPLCRRLHQSRCRSWTPSSAHFLGPAVPTPSSLSSSLLHPSPLSLSLTSPRGAWAAEFFFRALNSERMVSCFFIF